MISATQVLVALASFFAPPAVQFVVTGSGGVNIGSSTGQITTMGALPNYDSIQQRLLLIAQRASSTFNNWNFSNVTGGNQNYAAANMVGGPAIITRSLGSGANNDTTDSATNIIAAIPGAQTGQTFGLIVANMNTGTLTISGGTGVTMAGTATLGTLTFKMFVGQVTGASSVQISEAFGSGTSITY